jgi:hypothetical protein
MNASNAGYGRRLLDFWFPNGLNSLWWLLFALLPLYFFQTVIHEGSHAFAALFATGDFPKFAPFPHDNTGFNGFVNGVTFTGGRGFAAMPQFVDLALVVALSLIMLLWPIRNAFGRYILRIIYLGVCIDLMYNTVKGLWGGPGPLSDWGKFQAETSTAAVVATSWVMWLVILSHFLWVYYSAWHRDHPARLGFWDYRWVALALGLVSLVAIIVSAVVTDPSIIKGSVYFAVPLALQIASFGWFVVYFILSFRYGSTGGR